MAWPTTVSATLDLLTAINNTKVTLNVAAGVGDTSLTVDDSTPLSTSGYLTFDDLESNPETISYTGKSGNVLTGVTRGADGTAAGTHAIGSHLEMRWNAKYHNLLNTEIVALETDLSARIGVNTGSNQIKLIAGSASLPALAFQGDTHTGVYLIAANSLGLGANGLVMELDASGQVSLTSTSNQFLFGLNAAHTAVLSVTMPSANRVYTIPDTGADASVLMTQGTQTVVGATTFSTAVTITPTTNQLVLGTTRTVTISATQPASTSRTWTIPDITGNGTFAALEGTQTFSGAKTFSSTLTMSGATIAMGANKITGIAAGSASGDALMWGQAISGSSITATDGTIQMLMRPLSGTLRIDCYDNPITVTKPLNIDCSTFTVQIADVTKFAMVATTGNATFSGTLTSTGLLTASAGINLGNTTLSNYQEGTWTPADNSGASLSFTVTYSQYTRIGRVVTVSMFIVWPSTVSGATVSISGLPFTVAATQESRGIVVCGAAGGAFAARFVPGTSVIQLENVTTRTNPINSALSTQQLFITGFYYV